MILKDIEFLANKEESRIFNSYMEEVSRRVLPEVAEKYRKEKQPKLWKRKNPGKKSRGTSTNK